MTDRMGERGRQGAAPLGGHTPGPWNLFAPIHSDGHWFVGWNDEYGGHIVADRCSKADARLIAAAPELLAVAEMLVDTQDAGGHCELCYIDDGHTSDCIVESALVAVRKARGEQ